MSNPTILTATVENMRLAAQLAGERVFAYDPTTGERFSADPYDYFWLDPDEPLCDMDGQPLTLCVEHSEIVTLRASGTWLVGDSTRGGES